MIGASIEDLYQLENKLKFNSEHLTQVTSELDYLSTLGWAGSDAEQFQ